MTNKLKPKTWGDVLVSLVKHIEHGIEIHKFHEKQTQYIVKQIRGDKKKS